MFVGNINFSGMASKYIDKLIPEKNRIFLPSLDVWADSVLEVYKKTENGEKWNICDGCHKQQTLKYYVISLIFQKTRYLFYHTDGKVSPIVPRNLRDLRHLISTLCAMTDYTVQSKNEVNKDIFKEYFLKIWAPNNLSDDGVTLIRDIFGITDPSEINKTVIQRLKRLYSEYLPSSRMSVILGEEDEEIKAVVDAAKEKNIPIKKKVKIIIYIVRLINVK